jgi:SAM-dependent methyltransferase
MTYDAEWFGAIADGSAASAEAVAPCINALLGGAADWPLSVLDVGCGTGTWAAQWLDADGVDGEWIPRDQLRIPIDRFHVADLTRPLDMGRRYDVVLCVEVGEHLPESAASTLVASLCRHADTIVFSAAVAGQGGPGHINEQDPDYWAALFAPHGYRPYDLLRDLIWDDGRIEPWYRQNILVYATDVVAAWRRWTPAQTLLRPHPAMLAPGTWSGDAR